MFKKLFLTLLLPFAAFTQDLEKSVDISLNVNPYKFYQTSFVNVNTCFLKPYKEVLFVVNPRMTAYMNKNVDFSIGTGVRFPLYALTGGAHIFYDLNLLNPKALHQAGVSLELLGFMADHRMNIYIPFHEEVRNFRGFYYPEKWVEYEIVHKNSVVHTGMGATYNFTRQCPGAKLHLTVPMDFMSLSFGIHHDSQNRTEVFFSVGMKLFTFNGTEDAFPAHRATGVHCKYTPIYDSYDASLIKTLKRDRSKKKVEKKKIVEIENDEICPPSYGSGQQILRLYRSEVENPKYSQQTDQLRKFINGESQEIDSIDISEIRYARGSKSSVENRSDSSSK